MDGKQTIAPEEALEAMTRKLLIATRGHAGGGSTFTAMMFADDEIQRLRRIINKGVERRAAILLQVDRLNRVLVRHPDWLAEIRLELEYGPPTP